MASERRPATIEEMKASAPEGRKVPYRHAVYETARRGRNGEFITVQRGRSTAKVRYDEKGAFVMRKDQREDLKADYITGIGRPFVALWRASYLD